jgi:tungstate transport system permease protein
MRAPGQDLPVNPLTEIALRSLVVSGTATLLAAVLGIPAGAWLGLAPRRLRQFARPIVYTMMALPPVVAGLALYLLLSRSGPLGELGLLFTPTAMILAQTILALPMVVSVTMHGVSTVPAELALQLRSLGANSAQVRWTILREAWPAMGLAVAMALGRSLSEVGAVLIVGGNIAGKTRVLTTAIVLETGRGNFELALALGAILLGIAWTVNMFIAFWQREPTP